MKSKIVLFLLVNAFLYTPVLSKGLTFVIDTTKSMYREVKEIKASISNFLDAVSSDYENYVLVPFQDPRVGPVSTTLDPEEFKSYIRDLTLKDGQECPENSLSALKQALEVSRPESHIYMFTDASSSENNTRYVINLCKKTLTSVTIFLTGRCARFGAADMTSNVGLYREVTDACSGQLVVLNSGELRFAFQYMQVSRKWDELDFEIQPCNKNQEIGITTDRTVTEIIIRIQGESQWIDIRSNGRSVKGMELIDTINFKAYQIKNPTDEYSVVCRGRSQATVEVAKRKIFSYKIGFSTCKPTIMKETVPRPIIDWDTYVLIEPIVEEDFNPDSIQIMSIVNWKQLRSVKLQQPKIGARVFISDPFRAPKDPFFIEISGRDGDGKYTKKTSPHIKPQETVEAKSPTSPRAEIIVIEEDEVERGGERRLACKVRGNPRPAIWWNDDDNNLYGSDINQLLEFPDVYISYVTIKNIVNNRTYNCNTNNNQGSDKKSVKINVKIVHKFEIIEIPMNKYIEVGQSDTLHCKADTIPLSTTTWYFNDSRIYYKDNIKTLEDSLVIENMSLDDVGRYTCEIQNEIETKLFNADVSITGLEAPTVSLDNEAHIKTKTGKSLAINCRAQGKPQPTVSWKYKGETDDKFKNVPYDVALDKGKLSISTVKSSHAGFYRCEGSNVMGINYTDVQVSIESPPTIEGDRELSITVTEMEKVELQCTVESEPAAEVHWEMRKDDIVEQMDSRHVTDEYNTHRFTAIERDTGSYHCIAQNEAGTAEKIVSVNVLVAPYIQAAQHKHIEISAGNDVTLNCVVLHGNPEPTIYWEYKPDNSTKPTKLSTSNPILTLRKVTRSQEGQYMCTAENQVGFDQIKVHVRVC